MVYAWPVPTSEALDQYYSEGHFHSDFPGPPEEFIPFSLAIAEARIRLIQRFLNGNLQGRCLDVGAGNAAFGRSLRKMNVGLIYEAVEPSADSRIEHQTEGFITYPDIDETEEAAYRLLTLNQVLEHVPNPLEMLEKASRRLDPGGLLFVDVPNGDHAFKAWVLPHLLFWSKETLRAAIEAVGLEILFLDTVGMPHRIARRCYSGTRPNLTNLIDPWSWVRAYRMVLRAFGRSGPTTPLKRFYMDDYGGDRQWLRVVARRP
jgi:SAM-dependent methyltransferase